MALQFKRGYELRLVNPSGRVVTSTELRVKFEITKDLFGYPNLGNIKIYNLTTDRAVEISEEFTTVELKVGYQNTLALLFKGDIRNVINRREGVDTITEIFAGDGDRPVRKTKFSKTFAPGTPILQMVKEAAASFGIPNAKLDGIDSTQSNLNGITMSGSTKDLLNKMSDDYDFYWSIQDGQFTTQSRDDYDRINAVNIITRATGMIGSPAITEIGADVRTLLNPDLQPYRAFQVKTPNVDVSVGNLFFRNKKSIPTLGEGLFRVNKVIHSGDTRGPDWVSSLTGRRL
jgi:hypothetical protein